MLSAPMHVCRLHSYTHLEAEFSRCILCALVVQQFKHVIINAWFALEQMVTMIAIADACWRWPRWYWFDSCWYLGRQCQKGTIGLTIDLIAGKHEMPWNSMKCHELMVPFFLHIPGRFGHMLRSNSTAFIWQEGRISDLQLLHGRSDEPLGKTKETQKVCLRVQ